MIKLEDVKCDFKIVDMEEGEGLTLNKKSQDLKVTIYDENEIIKLIEDNFNKKYRSLLYIIMSLNESEDTTESDTTLAFLKIEDLKNKLLNKYFKFLNPQLLDKYLNMLMFLETKIPIIENHRGR